MRGIILLNGEPWQGEIEDGNAFVVCCDGALRWAKGMASAWAMVRGTPSKI